MVCIYCGQATRVVNSRHKKKNNIIWRRRFCPACKALFTSSESAELSGSFIVEKANNIPPQPFIRDKLFLSIYESCKHRSSPIDDAAHLTETVLALLLRETSNARLSDQQIASVAATVLERFDPIAATFYTAYHPRS